MSPDIKEDIKSMTYSNNSSSGISGRQVLIGLKKLKLWISVNRTREDAEASGHGTSEGRIWRKHTPDMKASTCVQVFLPLLAEKSLKCVTTTASEVFSHENENCNTTIIVKFNYH